MIKWFTTDLTAAKKTLIGMMIFSTISITYVNWKKISDKDVSKPEITQAKQSSL